MAKSLAEAGIDTTVIHDAATFAIMARVNKVLLPAHAVLVSDKIILMFHFTQWLEICMHHIISIYLAHKC